MPAKLKIKELLINIMSNSSVAASRLRLLLIEDDEVLRETQQLFLQVEGFETLVAADLAQAEYQLRNNTIDILLLDLGLKEEDGLQWLQHKRSELGKKGVVVLTARSDSRSRIIAAQAGSDIYLVKPVILQELTATLHNLGSRLNQDAAPVTEGNWLLNTQQWQLISPSHKAIHLTVNEMALMQALAEHAGDIVSKAVIVNYLEQPLDSYDFRRMEILVRRLRNKFREEQGYDLPLMTAHSRGYYFAAPIKME